MKKLLYIVDYLHNEPNSVSSILNSILRLDIRDTEKIVVQHQGNQDGTFTIGTIDRIKTYTAKKNSTYLKLFKRVQGKLFGYKDSKLCNEEHIKRIIEIEKPNLVFFFLYSPEKEYARICEAKGIPYVYMLYDTYLGRPELNCDTQPVIANELYVIEKSISYFVPSFFYDEYQLSYKSQKIIPYNLPLLVDINSVKQGYDRQSNNYDFTYFGQVQSFRNADKIKAIFESLNLQLDVFTQTNIESDDVFRIHSPVNGADLNKTVAHSKFLIAFDNSSPYERYLPSKAYLYVSFTKPIIAFGDNDDSALIQFFKDYPLFYYQNIHRTTDGLVRFINEHYSFDFNENVYQRYLRYLPENALVNVQRIIEETINNR